MAYRLFGILILFFSPVTLFASEVMFEGYYRVELENKPIGYTILRFSFDPGSNTFEATSFLRVKFGDKIVQESLKAKSDDKFHPISYNYTSQVGDALKMIDATFKGEVMTLKVNDAKKVRNETYKLVKGTFLSSFLPYLLLMQKLELNEAFKYSAIAEEEGNSYWGKAWLQAREVKPGMEVFTIMNKYKGEEFFSHMAIVKDPKNATKNIKGEVLSTNSPTKNVSTKLMASASQATEGQMIPNKTLLALFGGIPTGKINMVATPPDIEVGTGPKQIIKTPVPASDSMMEKITEAAPTAAPAEVHSVKADKKSGK
ncbi:MAG: hypothetical protein ACXVA9_03490 [Bdellovibrionales bacterium]